MNLSSLNTSKFFADPKSPDFEDKLLEKSKVFDIKVKGLTRKQILTYLVVLYDYYTELRKNIKDLAEKKREAATIAEFPQDEENGWPDEIIDMMTGDHEQFNQAVVEYLFYNFDRDFIHLVTLELKFPSFMKDVQTNRWGKDTSKMINDFKSDMDNLEEKLYGGQEVLNMRMALRQGTANLRARIRPEDEIEAWESGKYWEGPYGKYVPNKLVLVGSEIPEE